MTTSTALLDVNVLVALFDGAHTHHEVAHRWFGGRQSLAWATCPLTENGFLRVISSTAYPGRRTSLPDAIDRLRRFAEATAHSFWPDSVSILDPGSADPRRVGGSRQITDVYLLSLAVRNDGCLATFDRGITIGSVPGARAEHLAVIG